MLIYYVSEPINYGFLQKVGTLDDVLQDIWDEHVHISCEEDVRRCSAFFISFHR